MRAECSVSAQKRARQASTGLKVRIAFGGNVLLVTEARTFSAQDPTPSIPKLREPCLGGDLYDKAHLQMLCRHRAPWRPALSFLRSVTSNLRASSFHSEPERSCTCHYSRSAGRHIMVLVTTRRDEPRGLRSTWPSCRYARDRRLKLFGTLLVSRHKAVSVKPTRPSRGAFLMKCAC